MTRSDSHVVRKEACPKCRELGNDRSGDNLAVYSDGHTYCFRCGHGNRRTTIGKAQRVIESTITLPEDVTQELPYEALQYCRTYQLSRIDLHKHHIMWSDKWKRVIFPYFDDTGLIAWQGRYLGEDKSKAKWFSQGKIHEIIHPINVVNRTAVLVEDILSAIKVSKTVGCIPIFGSSISSQQWLRLKHVVDRVYLWLDPDMRTKSLTMASMGNLLGINTHVIFSSMDPKDHEYRDIADIYAEAKAKTQSNVNPLLSIL